MSRPWLLLDRDDTILDDPGYLSDPEVTPSPVAAERLQAALSVLPGERVVGFEIADFPSQQERNLALALTGVELLRDNILSWWS